MLVEVVGGTDRVDVQEHAGASEHDGFRRLRGSRPHLVRMRGRSFQAQKNGSQWAPVNDAIEDVEHATRLMGRRRRR